MRCKFEKLIVFLAFVVCFDVTSYDTFFCEEINVDKMGRVVEEIIAPTEASVIDPNTSSDAIRYVPKSSNLNIRSNLPQKNVYSDNTIIKESDIDFTEYIKSLYDEKKYSLIEQYGELTQIRYTKSISDVDNDRYELLNDGIRDRLKMKVIVDSTGFFFAKDGFFKVGGKLYYFDKDGYMVLGPAFDSMNNYYFFSYETGELMTVN